MKNEKSISTRKVCVANLGFLTWKDKISDWKSGKYQTYPQILKIDFFMKHMFMIKV